MAVERRDAAGCAQVVGNVPHDDAQPDTQGLAALAGRHGDAIEAGCVGQWLRLWQRLRMGHFEALVRDRQRVAADRYDQRVERGADRDRDEQGQQNGGDGSDGGLRWAAA